MSRSVKVVRSRKKSSSKKQKREVAANEDAETATTETSSDLTERTPLVEKNSRKQRKEERSQPTSLWYDLNLMCSGCCGAMEAVKSVAEDDEEDLFADDDNLISKFGHTIMHKAGFAPPVKIIRCTQEDDDSVITTPKVLIELAKQYDQERFWEASNANPQDDEGTVTTSRTALSITSMSKRLIPNLSLSAGRSRASKSVKTMGTKKSKKSKTRSSGGRYEI